MAVPLLRQSATVRSGLLIVLLAAATRPVLFPAEPPRFPTNEDLRHFRGLSDPRVSPDGRRVLLRVIDSTADGAKSHLWLVDVPTNTSRQLTYSPDSDKTGEAEGEWMPDGQSILFLAHRADHAQLFQLSLRGGEAKAYDLKILPPADASNLPDALPPKSSKDPSPPKAEPLPVEIQHFAIAPDGKNIAIIANDPKPPGEKKQTDAKADAVWVNHEIHGTRLYLFDIASEHLQPLALAPDIRSISWSSDSSQLLVIREEQNGLSDLHPASSAWIVRIGAVSQPATLNALPATVSAARFSDDSKSIVFHAQAEQDSPPGYRDLFTYDCASHAIKNWTNKFSGSIGGADPWSLPDGTIVQLMARGLGTTAARFSPGKATPELLPFPTSVLSALHSNANHSGWAFVGSASTQPPALFFTPDLAVAPRLLNSPSPAPPNLKWAPSKRIHWECDRLSIEGLLYLPPEAQTSRVPLIVQVHGGPLGAYADDYAAYVNFLIGHGWAVLRTNPRGSTNYGAPFAAANKNDLGGGDYRDIMAGVDFVLHSEPIDPGRLALEGYSYGGEMAGFVEGRTSRFKAIISGAPVIDQYSEYGTEGDSWYDRWYFGKPWEHPQDAWRQSPLSSVAKAKTPFLLLQGESDSTDPLGQSQEMYRALRQMNVPVDLVTYPRENHGPLARGMYGAPVSEPWHGFDARARIVRFLNKAFAEKTD